MNSFRFRSSLRPTKTAIAALVAATALAFPALAQDGGLLLPDAEEQVKPLVTLPQGASIDGAQEKVRTMATEAGRSLEDLIGSAVTPSTAAEVGEIAARKRRIMVLQDQLEEAKLAKELWIELNGEQDNEANSEEVDRLYAEKAALEAELIRLQDAQNGPATDPDPVVAEITGAAGSMRAKVLVPYMGEFMVERGTTLPNGMKVTAISKTGVVVNTEAGARKTLAFGTSVPRARMNVQPAQSAGSNNIIQQIGR